MDKLIGMRVFVQVVETDSFVGAAERLSISPAMITKHIRNLERDLGVRLLNRTTRKHSLTEAGTTYYQRCRQILAEIDEMDLAVSDLTVAARGTLRINAPMSFGTRHLIPALTEYRGHYSDVSFDLTLNDRVVDLIEDGFDLAIRIAQLSESVLIARRLATARLVVCAAPDYLAQHGIPQTPADLAAHDCLGYSYWSENSQWRFARNGKDYPVSIRGSLRANNGDALCMAALRGAGIILQPTFIVADEIRAGRLQRILNDFQITELGIYAVYPDRQYLSAKVRTFVDFLAGYFGSPPYWELDQAG
jgi:DNA-binding transcriptional LysR family regulator